MWMLRCSFYVLQLCSLLVLVAAQGSRKYQTLSGDAPLVIARGGFSGLFPDSSYYAYIAAVQYGAPNLHAWCDVQLTSDGAGICFPDIMMQNASYIEDVYGNRGNTYTVNGVQRRGWFSVDFTFDDLKNVPLKQGINTRTPNFDNPQIQILTVDEMVTQAKPPKLWLNVPYDAFFSQHNQSMRSFIISLSRRVIINYISSPEVNFLSSIASRFRRGLTKLVFQFLGYNDIEPSTNQTYGTLLSNLTLIRTFASGILVPKYYIWPVDNSQYLQNYTSLVLDAHNADLEVFASNFANDVALPYDYSYDPVAEYLAYIDNGIFSVDGLLSDFPITPSATIDCFSHMGKNDIAQAKLLVISSEGASGTYPGCTNKAYEKAVSDGVDILDCPVQMTNDGIPFCLGSINLRERTDAAQTNFSNLTVDNPDLDIENGIFAYDLTWSQIQSLRPAIANPYSEVYSRFRNPRAANDGKLMRLSDFLAFADNATSVSGILLSIENAAYLASNQGLGVTDAVLDALSEAGYNNHKAKSVMIKSNDSAVLSKSKRNSTYELVYVVDEDVSDILNSTILEIKKFASSVVISKKSVLPTDNSFTVGESNVVLTLQAFGLSVYVQMFRNEFVSQAWDFFADAYFEINTHVALMGIDGVVTEYPATAAKYKRNRCLGYEEKPAYMTPVLPGGLLPLTVGNALAPQAPYPVLTEDDVLEPPLPPVAKRAPTLTAGGDTNPTPTNEQSKVVACAVLISISLFFSHLLCYDEVKRIKIYVG